MEPDRPFLILSVQSSGVRGKYIDTGHETDIKKVLLRGLPITSNRLRKLHFSHAPIRSIHQEISTFFINRSHILFQVVIMICIIN